MSNMYTKSMSQALQEARDYRDTKELDEAKGHLSYDEWLKKEKGIAKGAHGINSDEHAKYSGEWRAYVKELFDKLPPINAGESNLEEVEINEELKPGTKVKVMHPAKGKGMVIGKVVRYEKGDKYTAKGYVVSLPGLAKSEFVPYHKIHNDESQINEDEDSFINKEGDAKVEMTITQDDKVLIIKTRDWQTYKAKGWVKKTNESLDLPATGDTTTSNASQEVEGEELNEGRVIIATDKKAKKKWQFSGGMIVKFNGKQYKTEGVGMQQVLELRHIRNSAITLKLGKKDIEYGFENGNFSVVNDGSVYQPWKN